MNLEKIENLPIEWKRGNGLRKSDLDENGKYRCVLYGELYTKHKNVLIDSQSLSKTDKIGKIRSNKGDVLVPGTSTAAKKDMLLAREINEEGVFLGGDINIIRPKQGLFAKKYLPYYFMTNMAYQQLDRYITGATGIIHISNKGLKNLKVPLISFLEQKKTVELLDKTFAAIAIAKANAEQNLQNTKELFDSYLNNIFENNEDDWVEKALSEVTLKIGSGATPRGGKATYKEKGISLIRSMNVHDFQFKEKNLAFIDEQQANALLNVTIQEEDILLNITGASIARCCVVPKEYLPARVNQHVSIIRVRKEIINPFFLASLLTSKFFKDQILEIGEQGATRQAITKVQLENFKISYPKVIEEQKKVIQTINSIKAKTKKLESIYKQKIADLEEMKKSILQKAFSGQLKNIS